MKAGDIVTWERQLRGCWTTKTRTVIAEVPAGKDVTEFFRNLPDGIKESHLKFSRDKSTRDRVLVAVPAGKNGQIMHYYCPIKRDLMSRRMYVHMKNTLKDIKTVIKNSCIDEKEKIRDIDMLIGILESVECGEKITSEE